MSLRGWDNPTVIVRKKWLSQLKRKNVTAAIDVSNLSVFCDLLYDVVLHSDCRLLDIRMGVEPERISKEGGGLVELIIRYLVRGTEEFQANYQTGKRMTQRKFEIRTPEQYSVALPLHDADWSSDFKRKISSVISRPSLCLSKSSNRNYAQWLKFPEEAE